MTDPASSHSRIHRLSNALFVRDVFAMGAERSCLLVAVALEVRAQSDRRQAQVP
jgi:hypothetical protein